MCFKIYALFIILYQTLEIYSFSRYLSIYHTRNYNTDLFYWSNKTWPFNDKTAISKNNWNHESFWIPINCLAFRSFLKIDLPVIDGEDILLLDTITKKDFTEFIKIYFTRNNLFFFSTVAELVPNFKVKAVVLYTKQHNLND